MNRRAIILSVLLSWTALSPLVAQTAAPKAADLVGTWQLVSYKDLKTGKATPNTDPAWMQFTRSHWTVVEMEAGRKVTSRADFDKLSPDAKMKTNYARVWNDKGEQIFAARGGTYTLTGDELHHPATMALYNHIIGVDRVLKITHLDKTALVGVTKYPDDPTANVELTYRRVD